MQVANVEDSAEGFGGPGSHEAEAADDGATYFSRSPSSLEEGSELTAPAASNPQPPSTIIPGAWPEPAVVTTGEAEDSSSGTEPPGWGRRTETAAPGEAAAAAGGRLLERLGAQVQNLSAELHSTTERLHAAVARPKSSSAVSEPVKRRKYTDRPQTAAEMAEKHRRERKNFKEKKRRERRQAERSG